MRPRLLLAAVGAAAVLAAAGRPLFYASVDERAARADGVPVRALSVVFLILLALAVADDVGSVVILRSELGVYERVRGQRGRACILHPGGDEIVNGRLGVLRPGIGHAELAGETIEHLLGALKRWCDCGFLAPRHHIA